VLSMNMLVTSAVVTNAGGWCLQRPLLSDQPLAEEWLQGYMRVRLRSKAGTVKTNHR